MKIPVVVWIAVACQLLPLAAAFAHRRWLTGARRGVAIWLVLLILHDVTSYAWSHWLRLGNNHVVSYLFMPLPVRDAHTITRLRGISAELLDLGVAVRNIARRLHPTVVDQVGFLPAVQALADEFRGASGIVVSLRLPATPPQLSAEVARAAYRIVQEALRNTARHSSSTTASVEVLVQGAQLLIRVEDSGRGIDAPSTDPGGIGLAILRERALGPT